LKGDKTIVLTAVTEFGGALEYAHKRLQADPRVVVAAVSQMGTALRFGSDTLKDNR